MSAVQVDIKCGAAHADHTPKGMEMILQEFLQKANVVDKVTATLGAAIKGTSHCRGLIGIRVVGEKAGKIEVKAQPGDNRTRRIIYISTPDGVKPDDFFQLLKKTEGKIKREPKKRKKSTAPKKSIAPKKSTMRLKEVKTLQVKDLPLGLQKKLVELQKSIDGDMLAQLEIFLEGEVAHVNGSVTLRIPTRLVLIDEDQWDLLLETLKKHELIFTMGKNPHGADGEHVLKLSRDLVALIPHLQDKPTKKVEKKVEKSVHVLTELSAAEMKVKDKKKPAPTPPSVPEKLAPTIGKGNVFWRFLTVKSNWMDRLVLSIWMIFEKAHPQARRTDGTMSVRYLVPRMSQALGIKSGPKQPLVVLKYVHHAYSGWLTYRPVEPGGNRNTMHYIGLGPKGLKRVEKLQTENHPLWQRISVPGFVLDERIVGATNPIWDKIFSKRANRDRLLLAFPRWREVFPTSARRDDNFMSYEQLRSLIGEEFPEIESSMRRGSSWLIDAMQYLATDEWKVLEKLRSEGRAHYYFREGEEGLRRQAELQAAKVAEKKLVESKLLPEPTPAPTRERKPVLPSPEPASKLAEKPTSMHEIEERLAAIPIEREELEEQEVACTERLHDLEAQLDQLQAAILEQEQLSTHTELNLEQLQAEEIELQAQLEEKMAKQALIAEKTADLQDLPPEVLAGVLEAMAKKLRGGE